MWQKLWWDGQAVLLALCYGMTQVQRIPIDNDRGK